MKSIGTQTMFLPMRAAIAKTPNSIKTLPTMFHRHQILIRSIC